MSYSNRPRYAYPDQLTALACCFDRAARPTTHNQTDRNHSDLEVAQELDT